MTESLVETQNGTLGGKVGDGVHVFREGSCWIQPPGIRHTVRGWSDDCELLEIIMPAEHETVTDD